MDNTDNETCETDENCNEAGYEYIYISISDEKVQDDLELIALVEGNPRLYDKRRHDYKNIKDRDMAWESIGNALTKPMNGSDAKHRWETLRNLYGRARRQLISLNKENNLSGSGQSDIAIEDMLTPQSKAIHRFLAKLYVPRQTTSNYKRLALPSPALSRPASNAQSPARLHGFSHALAIPSSNAPAASTSSAVSTFVVPATVTTKFNDPLTTQTQRTCTTYIQQKTQISKVASVNSLQKIPASSSIESTVSLCNKDVINIENESDSCTIEADDNLCVVKAKPVFTVPKADIRKRKKVLSDDAEVALVESSKAISTMCSELPKFLQNTTATQVTQSGTEEDKAMATVILQSLKRIPQNKRSRCMIKILEVVQSFEEDTA